jgi:hypothetical protein
MEREDRPELAAEILGEGLNHANGSFDHIHKDMHHHRCPQDTVYILWVHWERTRWRMKMERMVKARIPMDNGIHPRTNRNGLE